MKNAVFISSGIGNALLLVPLIKALRKSGKVIGFSTSPFQAHQVFEGFEDVLFDEVYALDSTPGLLRNTGVFKRRFDHIYMDHFAATRKNILFAHSNGKKIVTPSIPDRLPQLFHRKLAHNQPDPTCHEVTRYMRYIEPDFNDEDLSSELFQLKASPAERIAQRPYITLQPGSGNNLTPWKSLPIQKWVPVIEHILEHYDEMDILLLGDSTEENLSKALPAHPHLVDAIGKTAMKSLPGILQEATLHMGNDSALMHIAGSLGVPTVTVWGGSDPRFYGWSKIDSNLHQEIHLDLECGPCSRYLQPNTSRVELPSLCPDFSCLHNITSDQIIAAVDARLSQ